MHVVGKVLAGIGAVTLLLSGIMLVFGVTDISEKAEDVNYVISGQSNGTVAVYDSDFQGDIGFTIFVEGTYEDTNNDGIWDICDQVNITAIHDGKIMENFGTNESFVVNASDDERFYYEFVTGNNECASQHGETAMVDGKNLVKIGRACWGCMSGTLTIESNEPVWVVYDDEEIAELVGGFFTAFAGTCFLPCGCCLLILGLILGFVLPDGSQQAVAFTGTGVVAAPVDSGIPMPTEDSEPAHAYYGDMIARGFDPELAEKMTRDQYPGFNQ